MSKPVCVPAKPFQHCGYRGSEGAVCCCLCDEEMDWENCGQCGGDGGVDGYEEDPNWYLPGEIAPCAACHGQVGDYWCPRSDCPTFTALRIFPERPLA